MRLDLEVIVVDGKETPILYVPPEVLTKDSAEGRLLKLLIDKPNIAV
jgi:hypothetical protein